MGPSQCRKRKETQNRTMPVALLTLTDVHILNQRDGTSSRLDTPIGFRLILHCSRNGFVHQMHILIPWFMKLPCQFASIYVICELSSDWGCCFFPLRKCIFSVAATFWVAKLDFLCCWFFSCLGQFFSCLGRVFSRLGRFFPAASKMHFFCCRGAFVLLQGVFSAALNFSRCEAAFFAGVFFPLRKQLFPAARHFFPAAKRVFSVPIYSSCCEPVFFARCAKTRS